MGILLAAMLTAMPQASPAQTTSAAAPEPRFLVEFRLGALWPQPPTIVDIDDLDPSDTRVAVGGRFGWYPGGTGALSRLSLQVVFDYAPLGSSEYFDDVLRSFARIEGHWFEVTPALAVDVVKLPRFVIDAHVGPSLVVESTTYLLEREFDDDGNQFENVCDLVAFEDLCTERYRGAAAIGAGARWIVKPSWDLFVGIDYTWLSHDRHVLVGTFGRLLR